MLLRMVLTSKATSPQYNDYVSSVIAYLWIKPVLMIARVLARDRRAGAALAGAWPFVAVVYSIMTLILSLIFIGNYYLLCHGKISRGCGFRFVMIGSVWVIAGNICVAIDNFKWEFTTLAIGELMRAFAIFLFVMLLA